MSPMKVEGEGPHDLPFPQELSAYRNGEQVVLSFRMLFQGQPERVRIGLSNNQAVGLLAELRKAIESKSGEGSR